MKCALRFRAILPALLALAWWTPPAAAEGEAWAALNADVIALNRQGRHSQALALAEESLRVAESTVESDHPYLTTSLNNLGAVYHSLGRYDEAELLYRRTIALEEGALGAWHPRTAATRHNLSELLKARQQRALARKGETLPATAGESVFQTARLRLDPRPEPVPGTGSSYSGYEEETYPRRRLEWEGALTSGFRYDNFRWNIAGNSSGSAPNILSELTWRELQSVGIRGEGRLTRDRILTARGSYEYAWIYHGENQDSDYLLDDRRGEFSRSNNVSDEGSLLDATFGAGYPWRMTSGLYDGTIAFLGGYSYHEQNLRMTDGFQTIPRTGTFSGLDSKYEARWRGPWLGVDMIFRRENRLTVSGAFEYHWALYRADAQWNLRTDLGQPKSFRHTADGTGMVGTAGVSYEIKKNWALTLNGKIQGWWTRPGVDKTFGSDGSTVETRLNEVKWESYEVHVGAKCRF